MEVSANAIGGQHLEQDLEEELEEELEGELEEELKYGEKLLALEACIYHSPHKIVKC